MKSEAKRPVLGLIQCTNLGGMEQATFWAMEYLMQQNARYRIVTPRLFGPGKGRVLNIDPRAQDFEYRGKFGWRSQRDFEESVVEAAKECSAIWVTGTDVACLRAIKNIELPKVLAHHYHHGTRLSDRIKWKAFYHLLCRDLDTITYPTRFTMEEAINLCPWVEEKAIQVPSSFTMNFETMEELYSKRKEARNQLNLSQDAFVVGNAGWFIPRKRWDIFLETARKISSLVPNVTFLLCGGGPLENDLRKKVRDLGMVDQVVFTGWVDKPDDYFWAWDVCLFNTDYDALGRTPIEAACCGAIPVASVSYGGLPEFLENGIQGFITNTHDTDFLTASIEAIFKRECDSERLLANIRNKLESSFSPKQATEVYSRL